MRIGAFGPPGSKTTGFRDRPNLDSDCCAPFLAARPQGQQDGAAPLLQAAGATGGNHRYLGRVRQPPVPDQVTAQQSPSTPTCQAKAKDASSLSVYGQVLRTYGSLFAPSFTGSTTARGREAFVVRGRFSRHAPTYAGEGCFWTGHLRDPPFAMFPPIVSGNQGTWSC